MLEQVCDFVHNYFIADEHEGVFTVADGAITLPFLLDGQRFKVKGSALNDGIYTYHADGTVYDDDNAELVSLAPETFTGKIYSMAVPRAFEKIVADIRDWQEANKAVVESPYQSESFGGYSYTKSTGASGSGNVTVAITWRDIFKTRLNAYRKLA